MKKQSLATILMIFFLWGCGDEEASQTTTTSPNANTPPETSQTREEEPVEEVSQPNSGESDILADSNTGSTPRGLIPPTDADERLKQVTQGKNDPFSVLPPPQAVINIQAPSRTGDNGSGETGNNDNPNSSGNQGNSSSNTGSGGINDVGNINACGSSLAEDNQPSTPNPRDAKAVFVSGVMQIEGDNVAIVKTPEYDYSYPIRQGNYIANGLVLVKNIDSFGPEPVVVLEQYGQEVIRRVGEQPVQPNSSVGATGDFQLPFNRDQLNIVNNEVDGLVLTSIEDIIPVKLGGNATQPNQPPQEVIEISGYICNTGSKPITVTDIYLGLNTANTTLPPLNAYFQGIQQGDVNTGQTQVSKQPRIIQPNKKTLFRGTVANSQVFNTTEKIDVILSDWN